MIKVMRILHGSIRKKLFVLVLLATLPVVLVLLTTEQFNRERTIERAEQDVTRSLESLAELQRRITDSTRTLLRTIASIPEVVDLDVEKSRVLLSTLLEANPIYTNVILVDMQGNGIAAGKGQEQVVKLNFADRKQFKDAIASRGFSSGEFVVGKQSKKPIFPFGTAVLNQEGNPVGAIIIGVNLGHYQALLENKEYYKDSFFGLCDFKGIRIFRFPSNEKTEIGVPIKEEVFQAASRNEKGSIFTETSDGKPFLIAYTPLRTEDDCKPYMYMFLGQDHRVIKQRADTLLIRLLITSLLSLFLALTIAGLAGQRIIAKQILGLSRAAMEFSRGETEITTGIDHSDGEIGSLAETFESMVDAIRQRDEEKNSLVLQLNKSQKMDALGQLAGGIAHDFNNLLSGILGAAELLEFQVPLDSKGRECQQLIIRSASRAADLAGKLLAFSRTSGKVSTLVDMHSLIDETVLILRNTIDRRIEINSDLKASVSHVVGDSSLLQSALLNLGINASQAISSTGCIDIATEDRDVDERECRESAFDLKPGPHLAVEVRDSGCGIPEEYLDKIFEPFFTTKEQGEGTGLGLAAVYGTIKRYGGAVSVESDEESGTIFRILLPHAEGYVSEEAESVGKVVKGKGTILIVDDEETLRTMAELALQEFGYESVSVTNGREAIDYLKRNPRKIDLVLLDMIMPEMSGKECFFELKKVAPHIKVILCTGLIRDEDLQEMIDSGLSSFLHKPYQLHELSKAVDDLMKS